MMSAWLDTFPTDFSTFLNHFPSKYDNYMMNHLVLHKNAINHLVEGMAWILFNIIFSFFMKFKKAIKSQIQKSW